MSLALKNNVFIVLATCVVITFIMNYYFVKFSPSRSSLKLLDRLHGGCILFTADAFAHPIVQEFLCDCFRYGVDIITLEPDVLMSSLTSNERYLLNQRNIHISSSGKDVFLFGISQNSHQIQTKAENLMSKLSSKGFRYKNVVWSELNISSHHFFWKENILIHVVVLFERHTFYYSPAIQNMTSPEIARYLESDKTVVGKYPTSFDRFLVARKLIKGGLYLVPVPTMTFLTQLTWCRFIQCNTNVSDEFHRIYEPGHNQELEESFVSIVSELRGIMDPLAAPFWLASGTLLGWYRQCGIIEYTQDHDFAAWAKHSPEKIYDRVKGHQDLKLYYRYGYPEKAFELTLLHKGIRSDLFFMTEELNYTWYGGHIVSTGSYFEYVYSKFNLCSAELLGLRVLVPCTPQKTIEEEYGDEWKHPISQWSYVTSPKNVGKTHKWTDSELQKIQKL